MDAVIVWGAVAVMVIVAAAWGSMRRDPRIHDNTHRAVRVRYADASPPTQAAE